MWIFDSYFKGCVTMWGRERGLTHSSLPYPPSFYMHLKDPHGHGEMIEALESRFKAEECSFRTIYGTLQGYRVHADRKVAEKIEIQTHHQAELYNVDVRQDQRYLQHPNQDPSWQGCPGPRSAIRRSCPTERKPPFRQLASPDLRQARPGQPAGIRRSTLDQNKAKPNSGKNVSLK